MKKRTDYLITLRKVSNIIEQRGQQLEEKDKEKRNYFLTDDRKKLQHNTSFTDDKLLKRI